MAMMVVLALSVVILALGMAMIGLTGNVMQTSVDAKTKIKSRYAAESAVSAAIADAVFQAGKTFGGNISAVHRDVAAGSDNGSVDVSFGNNLGQEVILQKQSPMNGMRGNKIPLTMQASGKAGAGKVKVTASVALYQVPIYQFGVFYEGPLEITPGPNMFVAGRVHTNSDAWFRGVATLGFQGPVTVVGKINQWVRSVGTGVLQYQYSPTDATMFTPALTTNIVPMTAGSQPPPQGGVSNARFSASRLTLAIGVGTPRSILGVCDATNDPDALKRQKFDCLVQDATKASSAARFVYTGSQTPPSWIKGPYAFYDRRELNWVKVWDFDIAALTAASSNQDSIFYLDDLTASNAHITGNTTQVINAFRIINGSKLPRNLTIASGKPIYVLGDFNTKDGSGAVSATGYKNAQIASDAVTVLSVNWPNFDLAHYKSGSVSSSATSMEQPFSNTSWVSWTSPSPASTNSQTNALVVSQTSAYTGTGPGTNLQVNAAIITGNRPTSTTCLTNSTNESQFDACYEGGWHNTIRFLENWDTYTVTFKGSFVCMWAAQTAGLRTGVTSSPVISGGYYKPPNRIWGYDSRFDDLKNMPPGAPFLATAIVTNWLERN
jgi:hypothetical protein